MATAVMLLLVCYFCLRWWDYVIWFSVSILFCNNLTVVEIARCFILFVLSLVLLYVFYMSLPYSAICWFVICDCGASGHTH